MKVDTALPTVHDMPPNDYIHNMELKKALYMLHGEVLFHEVPLAATPDILFCHFAQLLRPRKEFPRRLFDPFLVAWFRQLRETRASCSSSFSLLLQRTGSDGQEFFPRCFPWPTQSFKDLDTHRCCSVYTYMCNVL